MDAVTIDRMITDALLLDAIEGLDTIAFRLADLYDSLGRLPAETGVAESVGEILSDLGWWSGRLQGAVSTETVAALERLASDEA